MSDDTTEAVKPRVQTAARTSMLLLEVARTGTKGISAKALAEALKLPRQVVYHLVHTLVSIGMLRRATANTYVLGLAVAPIAHGFRQQLSSAEFLSEYAAEAAAVTGETAYVVGWLDGEIVVLASERGNATITASVIPQGTAGDAHARASGKLLLAMSAPAELDKYMRRHEMRQLTPNTIVSRQDLERQFAAIRESHTAFDREEYSLGLSCMAVPIGTVPSQLVLGISAPTDRFQSRSEQYAEALRTIAAKIMAHADDR